MKQLLIMSSHPRGHFEGLELFKQTSASKYEFIKYIDIHTELCSNQPIYRWKDKFERRTYIKHDEIGRIIFQLSPDEIEMLKLELV